MYIARADQRTALQALFESLLADGCPARWLQGEAARALVPVLQAEACDAAVLDPAATDLDVHALHQGFLRGARQHGAELRCGTEVLSAQFCAGGTAPPQGWQLHTTTGTVHAARVVNAAGAWADELAARAGVRPIGLEPRRRSAFVFEGPAGLESGSWPCVAAVDESFYFKPEAGLLLGSPANADPVPPHDVMPEELDIATGIAHIEAATTLRIRRPRRTWAGLRSFVADGDLVGGFEPACAPPAPGFFWLAAQGGYGIQTSAAMGACCAALLLGLPQPRWAAAALPVLHTLAPRRT
jgi:D-arginine dehydrogenase